MSIAVKTADGWQVLGVGEGGGGSAWGDFTTNGDEQDSGTYGPDAQGRMWKWAEWNDIHNGDPFYSVNLTGGLYHVLTVGGGSTGRAANQFVDQGQPGQVNEGLWEFSANANTPIEVGVSGRGADNGVTSSMARPSSIGDYGTQGLVEWGACDTGRGATAHADNAGYKSRITGEELEYAPAQTGPTRPGRAGRTNYTQGEHGCVIIATVTNDESEWNPPGALPGLGTWATITAVSGSPKRYTYNDGIDWVAFEWTADGSLTTQAGGLVDVLLVSAASISNTINTQGGHGGGLFRGIEHLDSAGPHSITIGESGQYALGTGGPTIFNGIGPTGGLWSETIWAGATPPGPSTGLGGFSANPGVGKMDDILGPNDIRGYGGGGSADSTYGGGNPPRANSGAGRTPGGNGPGASGVAIVKVPAAQAAGVDPDEYVDVP